MILFPTTLDFWIFKDKRGTLQLINYPRLLFQDQYNKSIQFEINDSLRNSIDILQIWMWFTKRFVGMKSVQTVHKM